MSRYGKMRASFDSDGTSLGPSPSQSPPRSTTGSHGQSYPLYYVQSPSRDSFTFNEVDSLSQSYARSTPSGSPLASPLHKSFSSKSHGEPALHIHMPANSKPGSRRVLPQPNGAGGFSSLKKTGYQLWDTGTIQEEDEHVSPTTKKGLSRWCLALIAIFCCLLFIFLVFLIFWLVCRPRHPHIAVKSLSFESFQLAEANDDTGVPTKILTLNSTLVLNFNNPSKYFGMHVSPMNVELQYQELTVATGQSAQTFQRKRSSSTLTANVVAMKSPVYGAGPSLWATVNAGQGIPLRLVASTQSHVMWIIVKPMFRNSVTCNIIVDSSSTGNLKLLQKSCTTRDG